MPPTKTWKSRERKVAKWFGAKGRTPLSGGNSGHTRSDTLHDWLFIEHKHRKSSAAIKLWRETKALADKEGKIPVVTLSEKSMEGFLIVCHAKDLTAIANQREQARKDGKL